MAEEDKKGLGSRILGESLGRIKESLGVSRETQGFGEVMKQGFSAANMFGADSFLGSVLSSDEERERVANFSKDQKSKERETAKTSGSVSGGLDGSEVAEILKKVQEDVDTIREIKEEEYTAPEIKDPVKLGNEQLDVNKKILATLQAQEQAMTKPQGAKLISIFETALAQGAFGGDGGGGPGVLPLPGPGKGPGIFSKGKDLLKSGATKAKTFGKGLFKGGLSGAARFAGPAAAVGLGTYEAVSGANKAENDLEALDISAEEAQSRKGEAIGSGAGGAGGAIAGAVAGAAIGSAVPIVGTVIGGMIGGALGYFAGSAAGGVAGEALADAIPVSEEDLNESNQLANDYLDSISEKEGGSELVTKIKAEATEIESKMMEATGKQPEELSENDIEAIANAALIKSIQNNEEEALAIAGYSASEQQNMMDALEDTASGSAGGPKVGNSKRGLEIPDGQVTSRSAGGQDELQRELDNMDASLMDNASETGASPEQLAGPQIETVASSIGDAQAPAPTPAPKVAKGDSMSGIRSATMRSKFDNMQSGAKLFEMAQRMGIDPGNLEGKTQAGVVTEINGQSTAEFLTPEERKKLQAIRDVRMAQDQAAENALTSGKYVPAKQGTGLENATASTVESATVDAAAAEKAGSQQPVIVQAPAPAPAPKQDVNVVVSIPKTIGPDTASGSRQLIATSF